MENPSQAAAESSGRGSMLFIKSDSQGVEKETSLSNNIVDGEEDNRIETYDTLFWKECDIFCSFSCLTGYLTAISIRKHVRVQGYGKCLGKSYRLRGSSICRGFHSRSLTSSLQRRRRRRGSWTSPSRIIIGFRRGILVDSRISCFSAMRAASVAAGMTRRHGMSLMYVYIYE